MLKFAITKEKENSVEYNSRLDRCQDNGIRHRIENLTTINGSETKTNDYDQVSYSLCDNCKYFINKKDSRAIHSDKVMTRNIRYKKNYISICGECRDDQDVSTALKHLENVEDIKFDRKTSKFSKLPTFLTGFMLGGIVIATVKYLIPLKK